jgi:hypothetical protein
MWRREPLPRRLEGRDRNDGLVQLWRFRWVPGRQEVEAMRDDPTLGFRAPGTELTAQRGGGTPSRRAPRP